MKELQLIFNNIVSEYFESGKIEEKINAAVDKCFDDVINEAFKWGSLKKSIEDVVSAKMCISMDQIDIQSYNAVLELAINEKMKQFSTESAESVFNATLSDIFKEAPKEISMQDLADHLLKESRNDDGEGYGEYFHVLFEGTGYGSYTFKIQEDKGHYSSEVHLYISSVHNSDYHYLSINHEMDITNPTCLHGVDRYLFGLFAAKTKIIDVTDFDPEYLDTRKCDADY